MMKLGTRDARDVLERASARETAARVAAGSLARFLLERLGIVIMSRVTAIGRVQMKRCEVLPEGFIGVDESPVRCPDGALSEAMIEEIDAASTEGDSLGGVFEVCAFGMVPGLGSHAQFDRRLDAALFAAVGSIPAVKGVESGSGFELTSMRGTEAQDGICLENGTIARAGNRAGGIEGGISNGEPLLLRAAMKPIPSTFRPQKTVNVSDLTAVESFKERADVCAVPAASVIGEAVVALVLADAVLDKFGGDSMVELERNFTGYLDELNVLWRRA
jgi:chorismate synthase